MSYVWFVQLINSSEAEWDQGDMDGYLEIHLRKAGSTDILTLLRNNPQFAILKWAENNQQGVHAPLSLHDAAPKWSDIKTAPCTRCTASTKMGLCCLVSMAL